MQRREEVAAIVARFWLMLSSYLFDGLLRFWHYGLGAPLVVLLSMLQLWQDWELSDRDMLSHGH